MNTLYVPPMRVLEAQFIHGTKQIMHRVQLWLGYGQEPIIVWMSIEEWRQWCKLPADRVPHLAKLRQELIG